MVLLLLVVVGGAVPNTLHSGGGVLRVRCYIVAVFADNFSDFYCCCLNGDHQLEV